MDKQSDINDHSKSHTGNPVSRQTPARLAKRRAQRAKVKAICNQNRLEVQLQSMSIAEAAMDDGGAPQLTEDEQMQLQQNKERQLQKIQRLKLRRRKAKGRRNRNARLRKRMERLLQLPDYKEVVEMENEKGKETPTESGQLEEPQEEEVDLASSDEDDGDEDDSEDGEDNGQNDDDLDGDQIRRGQIKDLPFRAKST